MSGVQAAAGSLTVTDLKISGTVPKNAQTQPNQGPSGGTAQTPPGGGFGGGGRSFFAGPNNINVSNRTITGVDWSKPDLSPVTPSQITAGHYFTAKDGAYAAILSTAYAKSQNLGIGSTIKLGGKTFHVVGLASAPLGGNASDIYMKLATLQSISSRQGRISSMQVRATSGNEVSAVANEVKASLSGAQVTTAKDLANRV